MKKYLSLYTNKYIAALLGIMAIGIILLFAESDSIVGLFATKIAAIGCGFVFAALFSKWETEGKIKELSDYVNKED